MTLALFGCALVIAVGGYMIGAAVGWPRRGPHVQTEEFEPASTEPHVPSWHPEAGG